MSIMKTLKERLLSEMSNGLPFMEGKEKLDNILDEVLTVNEYGFLSGDDGEFIVYTTKEYPNNFFFGGSVLTERFKHIESVFTEDEIAELLNEGITIKLVQKKSKNKRIYVAVEFI